MMTGRIARKVPAGLAIAVAAGWIALAWGQDTRPATAPATRPAATLAERIAPFLQAIQTSDDYRTVMRAYARARAVDRTYVPVHRAYMRRMLKLGLPQIAFYPAQALVKLDRRDGMAWGVTGYHHGKRGRLVEAFGATMQAVALVADDPSILHNAGQLAAWYDEDPSLPRIPDSARRRLAKMRERLAANPIFARVYKQVAGAYRKRGQAAQGLAEEIATVKGAIDLDRARALAVDRQLRRLNDQIDESNRRIDQLWRELRRYYGPRTYRDAAGNVVVLPPRDTARRRERYERIEREEREVEALKRKVRDMRSEGEVVLAGLARNRKALERLRRKQETAAKAGRIFRQFRWDPPAVDGVVTDELDALPPPPPGHKAGGPVDPESEAAQRLDLAKLYLRHDMSTKAVDILIHVSRQFATTRAGKQAKLLLAVLRPSP